MTRKYSYTMDAVGTGGAYHVKYGPLTFGFISHMRLTEADLDSFVQFKIDEIDSIVQRKINAHFKDSRSTNDPTH